MPLIRRNITIRRSRAAGWSRLAGGLSLPVLALGVLGMRVGLVPQIALEPVLIAGFVLGLAALCLAVYALVDIWNTGAEGAGSAVVGIFYATPVLVVLGLIAAGALIYPRISDVATDVENPPTFVGPHTPAGAPNPAVVARQVEAYPEIAPKTYPLPLGDVFLGIRKVMDESGWTVTREVRPALLPMASSRRQESSAVPEDAALLSALAAKSVMTQSRGGMATEERPPEPFPEEEPELPVPSDTAILQAEAPTPVFGFLDDVVVRLKITEDGGTRVDMRSASRIGAHDLGENARRIKAFFARLDALLQPEPGAASSGVASAS